MKECILECTAGDVSARLRFKATGAIYTWECLDGASVWGVKNGTAPSKLFTGGAEEVELSDFTLLTFDAPLALGSTGKGTRNTTVGSFPESFDWECTKFIE